MIGARPAARHVRRRPRLRRGALRVRGAADARRLRHRGRGDGPVRPQRSADDGRQQGRQAEATVYYRQRLRDLLPNREETRASVGPVLRGSVLGFFLGLLPGGGAMIASFASYMRREASCRAVRERVRPGRRRGRRRARGGQQCRRAGELHPAALPRHPGQCRDRRDHGRAADPGRDAGAAADHRASRPCSGA